MYAPEMLQVVEKKFREVKGLIYFHNVQLIINEEGKALPPGSPKLLKADLVIDERIKRVPCSLDYLLTLAGTGFNNSSIAVKKGLLKFNDLKHLRRFLQASIRIST